MNCYTCFYLLLHFTLIVSKPHRRFSFKPILDQELDKFRCDFHDLSDTYINEVELSPFHNRSVNEITTSWQSTFSNGNYRTDTKNTIPYRQMSLRDPDTILRMAEYQALVYCKSDVLNSPSDLTAIANMAKKNLRVGNFTIEASGLDPERILFWYIASNIAQQSIILVHRGTKTSDSHDVFDDLDRIKLYNTNGILNQDFPYLSKSEDIYLDQGFHQRFQDQKSAITSAVRQVLNRYTNPSFSFIVVGHSLGAAWAYLNAGYFAGLSDINARMTAVYTFGQPLLGSVAFVDQLTNKLDAPTQRYVRTVNGNDIVPHIGCKKCIQPEYSNEKWVVTTNTVTWKDCQGGEDLTCSSGVLCNKLSWSNHSAVGRFSMRGEFCRIASNA